MNNVPYAVDQSMCNSFSANNLNYLQKNINKHMQ